MTNVPACNLIGRWHELTRILNKAAMWKKRPAATHVLHIYDATCYLYAV